MSGNKNSRNGPHPHQRREKLKAVMNCVTNAFKASIWDPNNVRVMLSTCISGPFGTLKFFLITVVIDLAKASLASRSDVFIS